jgi:uncharacterized membrane protein YhaH (DUF805 family)
MKWYLAVLKKYADFNGRARRSEYWYFVLFNFIISVVLNVAGLGIGTPFLSTIYSLAVMLPSLAVAVRRMHDVNKSGWYILIPIYNLILACTEGTSGPNDYGTDPKNEFFDEIDQWGTNQNPSA